MTWAQHLVSYYSSLRPHMELPNNVQWLYPQEQPGVLDVVKEFCDKYFADENARTVLLGINPGRLGAGVTGVNFTAPKQLSQYCEVEHPFRMQTELSAEFIYDMINAYGGPHAFYSHYFIGSVCPLGFVREGKNLNYYDDPELLKAVRPFIIRSMNELLTAPVNRKTCICLGGEKNYKFLNALNDEQGYFERIISVPHPRFIMQYKRKQKAEYIEAYLTALSDAAE